MPRCQRLVVEAPRGQLPRREVLDDEIGLGGEPAQDALPFGRREVERHAAFAGVEMQE